MGLPAAGTERLDAVHHPSRLAADARSIALAARIVRRGGLVVYPTDTVYGLGCEPNDATAVQRIANLKGRLAKPMPILAANVQVAMRLVELGPVGRALALHLWPGPVTLVGHVRVRGLPPALLGADSSLGVRVPGLALARRLLRACGGVLVGTSANRSGSPACRSVDEVMRALPFGYEAILDGGPTPLGIESTVVDVTGRRPRILRAGHVSEARIREAAWGAP